MNQVLTETQIALAEQVISELGIKDKIVNEIMDELANINNPELYSVVNIIHYGQPKAQPRARYSSRLNAMYDGAKSLKQSVVEQVVHQLPKDFKPTENMVTFNAIFYLPIPKSFGNANKVRAELGIIRPLSKPDKDNLEKLLYDALTSFLYKDDSCVVGGTGEKYYSCKPRTEITLWIKK